VNALMREDCIVAFGAGHGVHAAEAILVRHLDVISRRAIEGALAAMLDVYKNGNRLTVAAPGGGVRGLFV
jgi:hypothetical protein